MLVSKVVIVIGPPGTGKGTQCKLLEKKTGMIHISTGDICRDSVQKGTNREIVDHVTNGNLVPDELMSQLVVDFLLQPNSQQKGVLLDGYPRTLQQTQDLLNHPQISIDRVILLQANDDVCADRIIFRRIDPVTGESYNLKYLPPLGRNARAIEKRLVRRETDMDQNIVRRRLQHYNHNLGLILKHFRGKIFSVNGTKSVEEVFANINQALIEDIVQEPKNNTQNQQIRQPHPHPQHKEEQCVICMSEVADYLAIPCGHQCGCEECLTQMIGQGCPICRKTMNSAVRVYKSGIIDDDAEQQQIPMEVDNDGEELIIPEIDGHFQGNAENDGGWGANDRDAVALDSYEKNISKNLNVSVSPYENLSKEGECHITVTVTPPDMTERVPIDVCCVIDISGSMGNDAKFQDPKDETKTISEGMSVLDLVKHSVKTIIYTLTDEDRLSIVAFDTNAHSIFSLSEMNEGGRQQAIDALESLVPLDCTNIWGGLEMGLDSIRTASPPTNSTNRVPRKNNILLLTDGQPNRSPPKGEGIELKNYFETHPSFKCQVNTFGFGYSLKSNLLLDIAECGNGTFSFIPDAKIVGTCFVNAIANCSSNLSQDCMLHLSPKNGAVIIGQGVDDIDGCIPFEKTSWGYVVHIGPLQYGQSRDILFTMHVPSPPFTDSHSSARSRIVRKNIEYLDVTVEYESSSTSVGGEAFKIHAAGSERSCTKESLLAYTRNHTVRVLSQVVKECESGRGGNGVKALKVLTEQIREITDNNPYPEIQSILKGLFSDVSGRITKSVSTVERFRRWGQHYLRAIVRAHQLQLRTNFMDQGLQSYGGSLFEQLQDQGGKIFITLPMKKRADYLAAQQSSQKKQKRPRQTYTPSYNYTTTTNSNTSNTTYYGGAGEGCFSEICTVERLSTTHQITVPLRDVKKNDVLRAVNENGQVCGVKVECVVRIECEAQNRLIHFLESGLKVTPKHPIKKNGKWVYPKDIQNSNDVIVTDGDSQGERRFLYNLVLAENDRNVGLLVNGVECVTFGHGINDVWHPFYATHKVIKVLKSIDEESYNKGYLETSTIAIAQKRLHK